VIEAGELVMGKMSNGSRMKFEIDYKQDLDRKI
jgi:hypothetical protein